MWMGGASITSYAVAACIPASRVFGLRLFAAPIISQNGRTKQIFCRDKGRKRGVFLSVRAIKMSLRMFSRLRLKSCK